jgi:hypothetical protein
LASAKRLLFFTGRRKFIFNSIVDMFIPDSIILKTAVSPRKTRKTQKKSVCCICAAIHPLGDDIHFEFFRAFCVFRGSNDFSRIIDKSATAATESARLLIIPP